ncbi:hypothetical protein E4U16_007703 [Claviceps sp. LM84 group G4]|nr:hypothetical protein E4U33_000510 [Claviceps sp. LM78 group G4]KAG6069432.1 hypothetical protein E4U16_007703 [Claviceps sp. LM84 group G4]
MPSSSATNAPTVEALKRSVVDVRFGNAYAGDSASSESLGLLDSTIWPDVNGREQLELLAGHHRIRALEEWMKLAKLGEKELWRPCKFYDRGKLPA